MFAWITNNAVTIIVIAVMLIIIGVAVYSIVRDKKRKSSCCNGNCTLCGSGCSCEKK